MIVDDSEMPLMVISSRATKLITGYSLTSPITKIKNSINNIVASRMATSYYRKAYPIADACEDLMAIRNTSKASLPENLL